MTNRIIYELTDSDISSLVSASMPRARPAIATDGKDVLKSIITRPTTLAMAQSAQDRIKDFWVDLGHRMGFDPDTIHVAAFQTGHFSAVPCRAIDRIQIAQEEEAMVKDNIVRLKTGLIRALHILREVTDDGND